MGGKGMTNSPGFAEQRIEQLFTEVLEKQE